MARHSRSIRLSEEYINRTIQKITDKLNMWNTIKTLWTVDVSPEIDGFVTWVYHLLFQQTFPL